MPEAPSPDPRLGPYFGKVMPSNTLPTYFFEFDPPLSELPGGTNLIAQFRGAGVCYWDTLTESLAPYGQHAVRHAAAQSYVEAIDPSWNAVSQESRSRVRQWNATSRMSE